MAEADHLFKNQILEVTGLLHMTDPFELDTAISGIAAEDFDKFTEDMTANLVGEAKNRALSFLRARKADLSMKAESHAI